MMNDVFKKKWNESKHLLESDMKENFDKYKEYEDIDLVISVVRFILNTGDGIAGARMYFNHEGIIENCSNPINGTRVYLIPIDVEYPEADEYLVTVTDPLCNTQSLFIENDDMFIHDRMLLAEDLMRKMKFLYTWGELVACEQENWNV